MAKHKLTWSNSKAVEENARTKLPELVRTYFEAGRKLAHGEWRPDDLHRFRLDTKRVRYTLELFQSSYGPGLDQFLTALRGVQDVLGEMHDCATIREVIGSVLPRQSPERRRLSALLMARERRKNAEFRDHWIREFDAAGHERRWVNYLARPGRPKA